MKRKGVILLLLIAFNLLLAVGFGIFFMSVDGEKIDSCRELEHTRNEAYFECLEQNGLDTWDMQHKNLYLKITFVLWFLLIMLPTGMYLGFKALDYIFPI